MELNQTAESNKLLAVFMGADIDNSHYYTDKVIMNLVNSNESEVGIFGSYGTIHFEEKTYSPFQLQYHSSWDWLMPVIKKCRELSNNSFELSMYANLISDIKYLDIAVTWKHTIEFVNWYLQYKDVANRN